MAKKEATLLINIKQKGQKAIKGLSGLFKNLGKAVIAAGAAVAGYSAAVIELVTESEKFSEVQEAFSNMAAAQGKDSDEMLRNMRKLSAGTVSDLKLMQQANNALMLGLPVDRFGDMLTIARSASKATGESMEFMLTSIVTGMGRGSKLMLDNLGIVFDINKAYDEYAKTLGKTATQLTDAEKKQAFINKALEVGKRNAEAAGISGVSLADKWEQAKTKAENLRIVIGQRLTPAFKILLDKSTDLFNKFEEFATGASGQDAFKFLTKSAIVFGNTMTTLFDAVGNQIGGFASSLVSLFSGEFKQAWQTINDTFEDSGNTLIDGYKQTMADLDKVDEEFSSKKQTRIKQDLAAKQAALAQEQALKEQAIERDKAIDEVKNIEKLEQERLYKEALATMGNEQQMADIDREIANETNREQQLALLDKKKLMREKMINNQRKVEESNLHKFRQFLNSQNVQGVQQMFANLSTLSQSGNKRLVAIGKAAGIANALINTAQGVTKALATFPPPLSFALAGSVAAAGAVQIATIGGVQLAEGGIVPASAGGTPAIIGEGGRDEAVIPLDELSGGVGGSTYNFNGIMFLGDQNDARELAKALDEELYRLRQDNESLSFDTDLR